MITINGKLYICPTPLGNLEDITLRVLRILKESDLIAAEDTRHTRKLMSHYDIHTPIVSYHQHSAQAQVDRLADMIADGKTIALVSDAGTPGISDPGQVLVTACVERGLEIDPLPGPCAAVAALSACGFPLASFTFLGFLPRKGLDKALAALTKLEHPVVLYESPRRIVKLLESINRFMPERQVLLARELTKVHQQLLRGKSAALINQIHTENLERGEFTVVLGPSSPNASRPETEDLHVVAEKYLEQGMSTKDAAAKISSETGLPRREIYNLMHKKKQDT